MKKTLALLLLGGTLVTSCKKAIPVSNQDHSSKVMNRTAPLRYDSLQAIIDRYVAQGLPGVQVAVKDNKGFYATSGGYARIETQTPLVPNGISWIFSITKTYTAALVMKQKEKGLIDLDAPMARYLPKSIADHLVGSQRITVRMLLSHTSGLVDHTTQPEFLERQFTDPAHQPTAQEDIEMVYDKPLQFEPGSDFSYCNTNFLLLQTILEQVTGKKYEHLLRNEILHPLGLKNTFYDLGLGQVKNGGFPNYYVDRSGNGQLENGTEWNNYLGNASYSYGGIAATPADVIAFYEALINGRVVSAASLQEMKTWVQGKESTQPDYGLGMEYFQFAEGSTAQFGHEGDGVGNSTLVMYVPDNNTFLYVNITAGRKLGGPYLFKITDFKNEICHYVATCR